MQKLFNEMIDKNKTLANWTRERVDSVAALQAAWERLGSLVTNYQHLMSKQVNIFYFSIVIFSYKIDSYFKKKGSLNFYNFYRLNILKVLFLQHVKT